MKNKKSIFATMFVIFLFAISMGLYEFHFFGGDRNAHESENQEKEETLIYLTALDGSKIHQELNGEKFGCDDRLIALSFGKEKISEKELLQKMINYSDYHEEEGFYNVFQFSQNLKVDEIITEGGYVRINLSGDLIIGGMCDSPRVYAQIHETLAHIKNISYLEVFINGVNIDEYLSEKDEEDEIYTFRQCAQTGGEVRPGREPNTCIIDGVEYLEDLKRIDTYSECIELQGSRISEEKIQRLV